MYDWFGGNNANYFEIRKVLKEELLKRLGPGKFWDDFRCRNKFEKQIENSFKRRTKELIRKNEHSIR